MNSKEELWDEFCKKYNVLSEVPLFELIKGSSVDVIPYGKRKVLRRSEQMELLVEKEVEKIKTNFETNKYEGLIYIMYWKEDNRVKPLYIGKAEKLGKNKKKLSANITINNGMFCRWGYDEKRHFGGLSSATFQDREKKKKSIDYKKWAETLFKNKIPTKNPELAKPTYFWISAWKRSEGPWKEFGLTSLNFLECLLIGIASEIEEFADTLLNVTGATRRKNN